MHSRLTRLLLVTLAVAALATAGIVANLLLLGYADSRNDPVGKLNRRADITQPGPPVQSRTDADDHGRGGAEEPDD